MSGTSVWDGTTVWDGAVVLAQYLTSTDELLGKTWRHKASRPTCIELGAGCAAVSLSLAACRRVSAVTITDLPDMVPHLQHNLQRNADLLEDVPIKVAPLRWGKPDDVAALGPSKGSSKKRSKPHFDIIVGSDLVYYTNSEETPHSTLLLETLLMLASPGTLVFLSLSLHHNPEEVSRFLKCAEASFTVQHLHDQLPEQWRVPDVTVVKMVLREML
ncbi:MAG: hypothetical protein WDW38_009978 [Sanguina aurantia]